MSPFDTRAHKRFELRVPVEFEFKDEAVKNRFGHGKKRLEGDVHDISVGGICLTTKAFAPKGIIIIMYMKLPMEEDRQPVELTVEGEIRSVIPWKGGSNRFGIKFVNLDKDAQANIKDFIVKYDRRSEPRLSIGGDKEHR